MGGKGTTAGTCDREAGTSPSSSGKDKPRVLWVLVEELTLTYQNMYL